MKFQVTSLSVDLLNKRANIQLNGEPPTEFGFLNLQFSMDLTSNETDHQMEHRARQEAKRHLQSAIEAL